MNVFRTEYSCLPVRFIDIDYAASAVLEDELALTVSEDELALTVLEDESASAVSKDILEQSRKVMDTLLGIDYIYLRRKFRSPIMYDEVEEGQLIGPKLVQETTEKTSQIKDGLKAARDRQKSYADKKRKPLEFSVGDYVLLKVSPCKGVVRVGKKGKLAPRFVRPFEIIEKVDHVAYRLDLPEEL
nr:putative reverse transcriptase domain-containing protein [Tanacetum cinerariifolium]